MTLFKFSKLFLLLGCLILLLIPITHCQDEIIDDDDNGNRNDDDDDNIDSPFSLDDLFGDDDFDFANMEDFQAFFRRQIQDHTAETLVESITTTDLVLVLFINEKYPEDNRIYEEFYKTQIAPQFGSGAIEAEVMLARIFVSEDTELPDYYVPDSFPAIVLFDHVRMFEYGDQLELPEFFGWFNEITSREFTELEDQASLERFLQSDDNPKLVAFYSSRDIPELETLSDIVKREYLIHLDIRQVALCLEHCTATYKQTTFKRPSLVLFRDYEKMSSHVILDQHLDQADAVFAFCNLESLPPLIYFDELNQTKVFGEVIKPQITLILDPENDNNELISQFERSAYHNIDNEAKELRMTHIINLFDDHSESLQWFYNINSNSQLPRLFITETTNDLDKIYKYKYPEGQPINYDTIRQFVADYRDGKLEHFFISEEIPDNEGKNVQKVVGNSYRDVVLNSDVNYVLFICPDMEDYMCSDPMKIYEEVVKKMVENGVAARGNMKFGYIDAVRNELDMDLGDSFPDIKIFKAGDKKKPVTFGGYMTEDELSKWVKEQAEHIEHGLNRKDNMGDKFARNIEL